MNNTDLYSTYGVRDHEPLPAISVLVGAFIVIACSLAYWGSWSYVVQGLGVLLACSFLIRAIRTQVRPSPELLLYVALTVWGVAPLLVGVAEPVTFIPRYLSIWQFALLLLIISNYVEGRRTLAFALGAFLVAALIVIGYSLVTGELARASVSNDDRDRAGSVMGANTFGYLMLLSTVCLAYFWMVPGRLQKHRVVVLAPALLGCALVAVMTGSRKAMIGIVVFYAIWIWGCYRHALLTRPLLTLGVVLMLVAAGCILANRMQQSMAAGRFATSMKVLQGKRVGGGGAERIALYQEAMEVLARNAIVGIGWDGFVLRSRLHLMTHSDFLEVAVSTGLPGLALYVAIYVVLWRRAGKIARFSNDPALVRTAKLIRAMLLTTVIVSLGRTNYSSKPHWVLMACFIGYTNVVWRQLLQEWAYAWQRGTAGGLSAPWSPVTPSSAVQAGVRDGVTPQGYQYGSEGY